MSNRFLNRELSWLALHARLHALGSLTELAGPHDRQGQRATARDCQHDERDQPSDGARQEERCTSLHH